MLLQKLQRLLKESRDAVSHYRKENAQIKKIRQLFPGMIIENDVTIKSPQNLIAGEHVIIQKGTILHCGGMEWSDYKGKITVGNFVEIGPYCVLYGTGEIMIGDYCRFGPGAKLFAQREDPSQNPETGQPRFIFEPIKLGKACLIGAGAIILGGSELGDYCMVGPNAVIHGKYPSKTTLIGNPARSVPRMDF